MKEPALTFDGVRRSFGRNVALDDVSISVAPGTVLGLIGRNGAGKTTALRLAHGVLFPDAGRIRVLGLDPVANGREVRRRVSLLAEESALYPWMTVAEILGFGAALHPRWDAGLAESLRKRLDLDPGSRIKTLSRGTRAKVALVLAVACRPEVLLLDDPTAGLDPLVRREVLEGILDAVPAEGGMVVYASHLVHDVERVADRVAIMDQGRIRFDGSLDEIKARIRRATAVFDGDAPRAMVLSGQIDAVAEGRVLRVVSDGANGDLESTLRKAGAREVRFEALPLEEILVAFLRHGDAREADHA
ncbi:MAG: ABC transporter ATP-binding protein [Acidobacteriia bacterium]|nr:ABC transporter ATP-binding protein [Terriglobia bacterium]